MDNYLTENFAAWVTTVGASVLAGLWALLTFSRNNRIKAAEILLTVERDYSRHIKTLLKLEDYHDYERIFQSALKKAIDGPKGPYTKKEDDAIEELEDALRHFHVCANVRRLGIDTGAIDRLYCYYLRVLVHDSRPELRRYIQLYWRDVYYWAQLAGYPWTQRAFIRLRQLRRDLEAWWNPSIVRKPSSRGKQLKRAADAENPASNFAASHAAAGLEGL